LDAYDFYPSVPVRLVSKTGSGVVIGDFDTGASSTFVDYDWLVKQNVIHLQAQEEAENAQHLNQTYEYLPRNILIEIALASGDVRSQEMTIACAADWQNSPFVKVNPDRIALVGRDLFLALEPCVLLDFKKHRTEILTSPITGRTGKKITGARKRQSHPRRRRGA
jgi:extradiol dioxygenase family protein